MKTLWFDMDGTLNLFYDVPNWLALLRSYDASPYAIAKPALNMSLLARLLNKAQKNGYRLGIISWVSMETTPTYTAEVEAAKRQWLATHLKSVTFDAIYVTEYGVPKHELAQAGDILFDDNDTIREQWLPTGMAYTPDKIIEILKGLE